MTRFARVLLLVMVAALAGCSLFGFGKKPRKPVATESITPVAPAVPTVDKGDPDLRFKAALKLMKDRQPQQAKEAFASLSTDFPEFSGPFTDLGILSAQGRQRPAAIASFEKAVAANPDNAIARNWLGSLYRENNDYARAEGSYQKASSLQPDYAAPHLNLGILYDVYLKRPQDALTQYREYQRIAGTDKLIVSAWIKELEAASPPPAASPVAAPAAPGGHP